MMSMLGPIGEAGPSANKIGRAAAAQVQELHRLRTCTQSIPSVRRIASTTGCRLSPTTPQDALDAGLAKHLDRLLGQLWWLIQISFACGRRYEQGRADWHFGGIAASGRLGLLPLGIALLLPAGRRTGRWP
jgi:hypothetical protein